MAVAELGPRPEPGAPTVLDRPFGGTGENAYCAQIS